jgi:ADP-ribose pyrophosphatase YjhB (NUDIX family)
MPLLPAAIGVILNDEKTQVLLVKRHDVPVWTLPGGGIEEGERPEEALRREIEEETGYQVQILRQCAEYSPINRLAAFTSVFICQIQTGQHRLSEETSAIAFHPLSKLPSTFFPPHAHWLKEALTHHTLIQRPLKEVTYRALCKYFLRHPWQVLRFAWTRFVKI